MKLVTDAGALNIIARNLKPFRKRRADCVITRTLERWQGCDEDKVVVRTEFRFIKEVSHSTIMKYGGEVDVSLISAFEW